MRERVSMRVTGVLTAVLAVAVLTACSSADEGAATATTAPTAKQSEAAPATPAATASSAPVTPTSSPAVATVPMSAEGFQLSLPEGMEEVPLEGEVGFYTKQFRKFDAEGNILFKVLFSRNYIDAGTAAQMDEAQRVVLGQSLEGLELKAPEYVELNNDVAAIRTPLVHNSKYPGWNWTLSDGTQTAVVTLLMTEEYDEIRNAIEASFAFN